MEFKEITVGARSVKRVDDLRNKRYYHEFGLSMLGYLAPDEDGEPMRYRERTALAGTLGSLLSKHSEEGTARREALVEKIFDWYVETTQDEDVIKLRPRHNGHASTWSDKGDCAFVALDFELLWPRPSLMPSEEEFRKTLSELTAFLQPTAEELFADLKERAEFDEKIEIAANHAQSLVEHVRRQADEQARDITRHEQRLAALKAEYASEYETQVTKIMADEETWKSAAKHGFDEHAIAYVKEREAEIRGANKLGVGTMHVPQAQIIKRDAIREFVTEEDDEQRAT